MTPKHRAVQPRYGRLAAVAASVAVVAVALLSSAGGWDGSSPDASVRQRVSSTLGAAPSTSPDPAGSAAGSAGPSDDAADSVAAEQADVPSTKAVTPPDPTALPPASGSGRRIVFDQSAQRVWLVDHADDVERTYLGSGSLIDNLHPGTYAVYSRSRWAVGVDDSGVMQYFVRFTKGPSGAAIGFHTIPTKDGAPLQRISQLGTPQSHGCIRQRTKDAIALWDFAPEGTKVVVVA
ncbi:Lipoprotein-anchoring transpeptidase ErfK/SrfK [Nocardioides terrae]|uniref:Lipoprotein-anchoring transpeptidase ErfK/SrfK n=1 Tax=Nocardioides terrae TaxID=574651 RepID=A0A1I1DIG7_9ACTN|nr:L,D-transpeptidase [Nocardioides terrae]SFB74735.1 Lipoprotein-anchoring transpeptidase ErfK/SrfK [Nocardioides terrae]